jgi:predicted RND superfamily exporter protein
MIEKFCDKLHNHRIKLLILISILTVFFGWRCFSFRLFDEPNAWPPKKDPNVVVNNLLQQLFGGANLVTVQVSVKDGNILNPETLTKIKRITDKISLIWGNIPYNLSSIAAIRVRYLKGAEDYLDNTPLMETVPTTPEEMEKLKYGIEHNPTILGSLVSPDFKSTIITADFRTTQPEVTAFELPLTDPVKIYKEIKKIIDPENDKNHTVRAVGTPVIIGWVNSDGLPYIMYAFIVFFVALGIIMRFTLRGKRAIFLSLTLSFISIIWAFGLFNILFGTILYSSSAFIAPFIIVAATACHCVQFFRRFLDEECVKEPDVRLAVKNTVSALSRPIFVALITDWSAFVVLAFVPFDNVSVLGKVTALGFASMYALLYLFVIPLLFCITSRPTTLKYQVVDDTKVSGGEKFTRWLVSALVYHKTTQWATLIVVGLLLLVSLVMIPRMDVGQDNSYAIHNCMTQSQNRNSIFLMEQEFKKRFKGIYPLSILIKTKEEHGLLNPEVLKKIDAFAAHMEKFPEVAGSMSLPVYFKLMHRFLNAEDPAYWVVPNTKEDISFYLEQYVSAEPGGFDGVINYEGNLCPLYIFVGDTSHATVRKIYKAAKDYAESTFNNDEVRAVVGGGSIGIAMAFNENIRKWLIITTFLAALVTLIEVVLMLRSVMAGLLLLLPLLIGTVFWLLIVHIFGFEINSNTTTSMAIATGIGVDAEVYLLYRFREEFARLKDFRKALVEAFTRIRKGLIYSHLSLIFGLWTLIPIPLYIGYMGFLMGLIILTCFVSSFFLSPVIWSMLKPAFLLKVEDRKIGS